MENKDFFRIIDKRLQGYESPIDLDQAWENFEHHRSDSQRRKKRIVVFSIAMGVLLLSTSIYFFKTSLGEQELPTSTFGSVAVQENLSNDFCLEMPKVNPAQSEVKSCIVVDHQNQQSGEIEDNARLSSSDTRSTTPPPASVTTHPKEKIGKDSLFLLDSEGGKKTALHYDQSSSFELSLVPGNHQSNAPISALPLVKFTPVASSSPPIFKAEDFTALNSPKIDNSIVIYATTGIMGSSLLLEQKNESDRPYLEKRQEYESALETYTFQVGGQFPITQNWFLDLGFQYNKWFTRLEYPYEREQDYLLEDVVVKIISYSNGNTTEIRGDTIVTGTQNVQETAYSTYNAFNLNVSGGRKILERSMFKLSMSGGVSYNLFTNFKGRTINPNDLNSLIELRSQPVHKQSFGLAVQTAILLHYKVGPKWSLVLRPQASLYLMPNTAEEYPLKMKMLNYGGSLGVQYHWQ